MTAGPWTRGSPTDPAGPPGWAILAIAGVVGAIGIGLAWSALMPGLGLWDTGELQVVGPVMGTAHPTGFPAYVLLGWLASVVLAPLGEPALRMNVLSALLVGVAGAATTVAATRLTGRWPLGMAAGIGLVATPLVWRIGTRADVHALHLAVVALLVAVLVEWAARRRADVRTADRWLVGAAVLVGVALANHRLVLFLLPGVVAYVSMVDRGLLHRPRRLAGLGLLALVVAGLLYLELPLRAGPFRAPLVYGQPDTLIGFLYVVLGVQFGGTLGSPIADLGAKLQALADLAGGQLGPLAATLPLAAATTVIREPAYAVLSVPAAGLTWLFAAAYENADIERYYLIPALFAWTWLAVAAAALLDLLAAGWQGTGMARQRPWHGHTTVAATAAGLVAAAVLLAPTVAELDRRHERVDARSDIVARRWLEGALDVLEPDAVVVSWWSYSTPLWYAQHIEGRIPGVRIVDDRTRLDEGLGDVADVIDAALGRRPVYAIRVQPRDIAALVHRYDLEIIQMPAGQSLIRILGARATAP